MKEFCVLWKREGKERKGIIRCLIGGHLFVVHSFTRIKSNQKHLFAFYIESSHCF